MYIWWLIECFNQQKRWLSDLSKTILAKKGIIRAVDKVFLIVDTYLISPCQYMLLNSLEAPRLEGWGTSNMHPQYTCILLCRNKKIFDRIPLLSGALNKCNWCFNINEKYIWNIKVIAIRALKHLKVFWNIQIMKTKIILRICADYSGTVFLQDCMCSQRRLRSACGDTQAD